jgi:hypothetical protein
MKRRLLIVIIGCIAIPSTLRAQHYEAFVGNRIRVEVTDSVLRSPRARPGRLERITGRLHAITADTIRLEVSPSDSLIAIPRILIYSLERSLGTRRQGMVGDAALVGGGIGVVIMAFFPERLRLPIAASGYALGALVGLVMTPYEQWEPAWLPEVGDGDTARDR